MATQPDSRPDARRRRRNADLLAELLPRAQRRLLAQARRHAELPDDADDALQSAYALFLERYNGIGEPLAWLNTTVKREAWAIRRRASRRRERSHSLANGEGDGVALTDMAPSEVPSPDERVLWDETVNERRKALAALKPDERLALWLLGIGLSYREICEATGWTHTKVNRCLSEGRVALREMKEKEELDF